MLEQLDEDRLGPLEVVDEEDQRALGREGFDRSAGPPSGSPRSAPAHRSDPTTAATRSRTRSARSDPATMASSLASASVAGLAGPDAGRREDELSDRPVGDPIAVRQAARAQDVARSAMRARASATRRLLPTPGAPMTVTKPGVPSETTRSKAARRASSSAARPTNGVVVRRTIASPSVRATRRTADETGLGVGIPVGTRLGRGRAADQALGLGGQQDLAAAGPGGEASRDLERRAGERRARPVVRAGQDLAGRDPDAGTRLVGRAAQLGRRPDGAQGVILAGDGQPEHGGHAIVIGPVDRAAVALDRAADDVEGAPVERLEELGSRLVVGRSDDVGAEDGDDPPGAAGDGLDARRASVAASGDARRRRLGRGASWVRIARSSSASSGLGIEAELVGQVAAGVLVGLERLALAAVGVQGEHEQPPQPFAAGLLGHQATELADRLAARAGGDPQLEQLLEGLEPQLLEPIGLAPGELLAGQVAEGRPRPLGEGLLERGHGRRRASRRRAPRGPAGDRARSGRRRARRRPPPADSRSPTS